MHPLIEAYLGHLAVERRVSAHTVDAYRRDLSRLSEAAAGLPPGPGTPVDALDRRALEEIVRGLMAQGRSPRSVARAVACYRGFYRFLVVSGRRRDNPADDLRAPRAWKTLPKYLSLDDVDALLNQPDTTTPRGLRDRALIELLYATGLRVSELVGLKPSDVNLEASLVTCIGKGAKDVFEDGRPVKGGRRSDRQSVVSAQKL